VEVAGGTRASARRKGGPEAGRASLTFRSRCAHVLLTVRVYSGGAVRPSSTREAAQRHFRPILAAVRQTSSDGDVFEALASNFSRFRSASFARTLQQLRRFNRDDSTTLLLEGESGTGKTSIARWLHANSARSRYPFQHAVLSAMDDALAASDLFGHVSGAYTDAKSARAGLFTAAHGGTLFLDEIGKASLNVQQKLLHAIEYGELRPVGSDRNVRIDVRLIVATNVPLEEKVADGSFLPDLYARISAFRTRLPPLRERRADIPVLVGTALRRHAEACGYSVTPAVHPELLEALERAPWMYNLRELDSTVHRLMLEADGESVVSIEHCRAELRYLRELTAKGCELTLERISDAIERTGSVSGAARMLGVARTTVHRHQRRGLPGKGSQSA